MINTKTQTKIRKLLSELANFKSSGCLWFDTKSVSWKIYIQKGSLKYVYCSAQLLDQLKYYLHYLGFKQAVAALKKLRSSDVEMASEVAKKSSHHNLYSEVICWLLEEKYLTQLQNLLLIEHISKEGLRYCLWSEIGNLSWHDGHVLPLWIIDDIPSLSISEFLEVEGTKLKQWQNCSKKLLSVHQRPYFVSDWEQQPLPTSGLLQYKNLQELTQIIQGHISINQLSLFLRKDELDVAKILSPYIDAELIKLRDAQPPLNLLPNIPQFRTIVHQSPLGYSYTKSKPKNTENHGGKIWKIVCIDDSPTILTEMQRFLGRDKFKVTAVDDPVQAVPVIFKIKPDLILLDITMPRINGYKLCGLLRGSDYCAKTPIVMVTGNTGLIDKARAKIAGSTDYLTKPFTREGLAQIVAKHLQ